MTLNSFYESDTLFEQDDLSIYLPLENSITNQSMEETIFMQKNNNDQFNFDSSLLLGSSASNSEETGNGKDEDNTETFIEQLWDEFQITDDFSLTEEKSFFPLSLDDQQNAILEFSDDFIQNCSNDEIQIELFNSNPNNETKEKEIKIENTNRIHNDNESKNKNENKKKNENKNKNENRDNVTINIEKEMNLDQKKKQNEIKTTKKKIKISIQRRSSSRNRTLKKTTELNKNAPQKKRNLRKRNYKNEETNTNPIRKEIVDCGKEMYKLLTSEIWVMTGGANQKQLQEFTNFFANTIGEMLGANEKEIPLFKSPTKYLLSNSRRTLTEYISELILGSLALNFYNTETQIPEISRRLYSLLSKICNQKFINNNNNKTFDNYKKPNDKQKHKQQNLFKIFGFENNIQDNQNDNTTDIDNAKDTDELKEKYHYEITLNLFKNLEKNDLLELDQLFEQIFTEKVLLYWFEKRFMNKFSSFINLNKRTEFCSNYLLPLVKTKFFITCNLLAQDAILNKQYKNSFIYQYCNLIENDQDGNVFNVYNNVRKGKLKLIKELIVEFGLNDGQYWQALSNHFFFKNGSFNLNSTFEKFPFKTVMQNFKNHSLVIDNTNLNVSFNKQRKLTKYAKIN
ncbi:yl1 nuclear protein [Anaeramoeba flamelloides]|uniref:Yl1 nuclear protein n=1 Tax=Anaeramoeba flamelloides TaxID=1746091 RepID=A0AAV7ZHX2_9EUKA|nr:yl1 nuclear protein [Anaeramoeba flamelloides]